MMFREPRSGLRDVDWDSISPDTDVVAPGKTGGVEKTTCLLAATTGTPGSRKAVLEPVEKR